MAGITEAMVARAYQELRGTCGGNKNDYFGLLYLNQIHDLPIDKARDQVAFGGNDYGLDGFYFDEKKRNLYLYQFKFSDNHSLFKDSLRRLTESGMEQVFKAPHRDASQNQMLPMLHSCLFENRAMIDQVIIRFVYTGDPKEAERSLILDKLREDLENKRYLVHEFFGEREVLFAVEFRSVTGKIGPVGGGSKAQTFPVKLGQMLSHVGPDGQQMSVGYMRLVDLYGIYRELGARFFERNIRFGYDTDGYVNNALLRAFRRIILEEEDDPSVFAFDHNGISMYAEKVEPRGDECVLVSPRLLNGAQTVTTFGKFRSDNEDNPILKKRMAQVEQLQVMCKIITNATPAFVTRVTINNNRQNPVEAWNLRANDDIQLELHEKFQELGIYYERQENAFKRIDWDELAADGVVDTKAIEMRKLAQTYVIADGQIDRLSRMTEVFEEDKLYEQVFSRSRLRADTKRTVVCYKIAQRLNKILSEIRDKGCDRYAFIGKARHLVWALVWQGLLNEHEMGDFADSFGGNMTVPAEFTESLVELGTTRCRMLISELIAVPEYADKMEQEKYGFLRSQAAFKFCMDKARRRWGWKEERL
jgi:hypothetical protein